ncbi:MAG: putative tellurite resistance protein B-like protein [Pseudohongiellaceae bacterium]
MIQRILSFFEDVSKQDAQKTNSHSIDLASLALLIEVAKSDHDISPLELEEIVTLAIKTFGISPSEQTILIAQAKEVANNATSLFEYTSVVNEHYSEKQKFQLILAMWRVAYADSRIDRYEEHLIRKIADLIYLPHMKFIEAKHNASEMGTI